LKNNLFYATQLSQVIQGEHVRTTKHSDASGRDFSEKRQAFVKRPYRNPEAGSAKWMRTATQLLNKGYKFSTISDLTRQDRSQRVL
jgi:hypothetical protein